MLSIILAIISIILTAYGVFVTFKLKSKKDITAAILAYNSSNFITDEFEEKIQILYKNRELDVLNKFDLMIKNTGNANIDGKNIIVNKPILISVANNNSILSYNIIAVSREGIRPTIERISANSVKFHFELLKPSEFVRIRIFATGKKEDLQLEGRIEEIEDFNEKQLIDKTDFQYFWLDFYRQIFLTVISLMVLFFIFIFIRHSLSIERHSFAYNEPYTPVFTRQDSVLSTETFKADSLNYVHLYAKPDTVIHYTAIIDSEVSNIYQFYYFRKIIQKERFLLFIQNLFKGSLIHLFLFFSCAILILFCFKTLIFSFKYLNEIHTHWPIMTMKEKEEIIPFLSKINILINYLKHHL